MLILFIFLPHKLLTALIFFVKALKQQRAAKISRCNQKPAPYHAYYFYSDERLNKNIQCSIINLIFNNDSKCSEATYFSNNQLSSIFVHIK